MAGVSMKSLRTITTYAGLALGVIVGGVVMGAMVVAPAVARARPVLQNVIGQNQPNVAVAPGGELKTTAAESAVAVVSPFKPMAAAIKADAIVDAAEALANQSAAPSGMASPRPDAQQMYKRLLAAVAGIPARVWYVIDVSAVLLLGGLLYARRRAGAPAKAEPVVQLVAAVASKGISGKSNRTPRAVVALAESGASAADIARRTRMPLDAVAMCLSMGSTGARQLRPPTA
jgi:hypothetical protein